MAASPTAPPPPRVRVRDALRRLVAGGDWPLPSWTVLQNRLLDEVGSDLRPLAALLARAGEVGLVDQLPASPAAWPHVRGALVLSLTHQAFLQPEMARWAVECWAFAVGVVGEDELTVAADPRTVPSRAEPHGAGAVDRPPPPAAGAAGQGAPRPSSQAPAVAAGPAARPAAARPAARPSSPPAPPFSTPPTPVGPFSTGAAASPAGPVVVRSGAGAAAAVSGARPSGWAPSPGTPAAAGAALSPPPARRPRRRGVLPEGLDNPVAHASLLGIVGFVGYVIYSATGLRAARATEVPADAARPPAPVAAGVHPAAAPAPGIPGVTSHGLPSTTADSARMIRVVPARRPTLPFELAAAGPATAVAPGAPAAPVPAVRAAAPAAAIAPPVPPAAAPRPAPPSAEASPDGYDRLRLRDGQVLRGRVELVRVSHVVFRDAQTGLRYEYPKADVDAVVTEFGSVVRFSAAAATAPATVAARAAERAEAALVRRGVGGRYRVRYTLVSVSGSPECRRGWSEAPPPAWARVDHAPGADTLAVTFEGGATFASVIDGEAQFASTFVIVPDQAYTGSALTTRLNGRFVPGGFDAAVNLVGYRRVSAGRDVACHTVLRAAGERAPDAPRRRATAAR